ncbi:MAG TPA: polysaccharide deacetylase family protein [Candidatus Dormibacteraeota bacterium]|nr:polysaccharide deacetylase family protein [Candidatus Dormibacteraeota bacterium]
MVGPRGGVGTRPRSAAALVLAAAGLLLTACSALPTAARTAAPPAPVRRPAPAALVVAEARRFMAELLAGRYDAQWAELAPAARAQWPSPQVRSQVLEARFAAARPIGFTLGSPVPGATWVSQENLTAVGGLWRVPVDLTIPGSAAPAGVGDAYRDLALYLSGGPTPLVVGEGPASLDAPIILPAAVPPRRLQVPILMYHRVAPYPSPSRYRTRYDYQLDYGLTVDPQEFAAQVGYLAAHGYTAISLTRLADALLYGLPLPPHPVVFTFDDGRASPYTYAVPVLRRAGYTAVFFVPSGLVGWDDPARPQQYLTADQLRELVASGFWVEDHTLKDNQPLWGVPDAALSQLALDTRRTLESITGQPIQWIAYTGQWPYPSASQAGPAELALFPRLQSMGYVGGVVDARLDATTELSTQLWQLPRVRVGPNEPLSEFIAHLP